MLSQHTRSPLNHALNHAQKPRGSTFFCLPHSFLNNHAPLLFISKTNEEKKLADESCESTTPLLKLKLRTPLLFKSNKSFYLPLHPNKQHLRNQTNGENVLAFARFRARCRASRVTRGDRGAGKWWRQVAK